MQSVAGPRVPATHLDAEASHINVDGSVKVAYWGCAATAGSTTARVADAMSPPTPSPVLYENRARLTFTIAEEPVLLRAKLAVDMWYKPGPHVGSVSVKTHATPPMLVGDRAAATVLDTLARFPELSMMLCSPCEAEGVEVAD